MRATLPSLASVVNSRQVRMPVSPRRSLSATFLAFSLFCCVILCNSFAHAQVVLINTETTSVGSFVTSQSVQNLPISNHFGIAQFTSLEPGNTYASIDDGGNSLSYRASGASASQQILQVGDPAPGISGGQVESFDDLYGPTPTGLIEFSVDFNKGDGQRYREILTYNGTSFATVASSNQTAPGTGGKPYGLPLTLKGLSSAGASIFTAGLQAFPPVEGLDQTTVFLAPPGGGTVLRVAGIGDNAVGPQGGIYSSFEPKSINALGQALIQSNVFVGGVKQPGFFFMNAIGSLQPIAITGNANPLGGTLPSLKMAFLNDLGNVFLQGSNSIFGWSQSLGLSAANPLFTVPPPAGVAGTFGVITPPLNLLGIDNSGDYLFVSWLTGANSFSDFALFRYFPPTSQYDLLAYNKQVAPGVSGKTFSIDLSLKISYTLNGNIGFRAKYNEGGFGLFVQTEPNPLLKSVVTDGQATPSPITGTYKLSTNFKFQALLDGSIRFSTPIGGGNAYWGDFKATPSGTTFNVTPLRTTLDLLPSTSRTVLGEPTLGGSRYVGFPASRAGGPGIFFGMDRISGAMTNLFGEAVQAPGMTGFLGSLSDCSPFSVDINGRVVFSSSVLGGPTPATGLFAATYLGALTKIVGTNDPSPISGKNFQFLSGESFGRLRLSTSFGRTAFFDTFSDGSQGIFLYDPTVTPSISKIALSGDTIGTLNLQSFYSDSLRLNSLGKVAFAAKTNAGTNFFTGNALGQTQLIDSAGPVSSRNFLMNIIGSMNLNDFNLAGYGQSSLNSGVTSSGFFTNLNGVKNSFVLNGDAAPGGGNFNTIRANSFGDYFSTADFKLSNNNGFFLRSYLTGSAATNGYYRKLSGGNLQPIVLQGQTLNGLGSVYTIPAGSEDQPFVFSLDGTAGFPLTYTNSSSQWIGAGFRVTPSGTFWKIVAAGDTLSGVNATVSDIGATWAANDAAEMAFKVSLAGTRGQALLLSSPPAGPNSTSAGVVSSLNPAPLNSSVILTATVTNTSSITGTPTGTVVFQNGGVAIGSALLNGSGLAALTTSSLSAGTDSITSRYTGDTNFSGSLSPNLAQIIVKPTTATGLGSTLNPSFVGQAVTFTVTVNGDASVTGPPTGTVNFFDNTTKIGTGTVSPTNQQASYTTSTLANNTHSISATYAGDSNFAASTTTTPLAQVVNLNASSSALTSSLNPSVGGQGVTFTGKFSSTGSGTPTGFYTLYDGTAIVDTANLNSSNQAIFNVLSLSVGTHSMTAQFSGDTIFASSTSTPLTQTINVAGFAQPSQQSVTAGQTLPVNLTFYGAPGTTVSYTFSASNLPANSSGSFMPSSAVPTVAGTPVQFMLQTHAATPPSQPQGPSKPFALFGFGVSLVAALMVWLLACRRVPRRRLAYGMTFAAVILIGTVMIGCTTTSSGSGGGSGPTAKGADAITIIATPAGGGSPVNAVLNITVQ